MAGLRKTAGPVTLERKYAAIREVRRTANVPALPYPHFLRSLAALAAAVAVRQ